MADVIVIGKINRDAGGGLATYNVRSSTSSVNSDYGNRLSGWGDTAAEVTAAVNVRVSNATNQSAAETAAKNVARVLAEIEAELAPEPPNTVHRWGPNGDSMTSGQILQVLRTTTFVVSDQSNYGNGGVASADYVSHTDTLNFSAFDGIVGPGETGDYASPSYVNDAGLRAILVHEIGHLSAAGYAFHQQSVGLFHQEHGNNANYYGTLDPAYTRNEERYLNDFSASVRQSFGWDAGTPLTYETGAIDPQLIYDKHTGNVHMIVSTDWV